MMTKQENITQKISEKSERFEHTFAGMKTSGLYILGENSTCPKGQIIAIGKRTGGLLAYQKGYLHSRNSEDGRAAGGYGVAYPFHPLRARL